MSYILGKINRTDINAIETWSTDITGKTTRSFVITAFGSTRELFTYIDVIPDSCTASVDTLMSLGIEAIHYILGEAERENRTCHVREIFALFNDMLKLLGKSEKSSPNGSFENMLASILASECDASITLSGIDRPLNRVEAIMALQEMNTEQPISVAIKTYKVKNNITLTYTPQKAQ